jgi:phage shock protein C
MYEKKIGGVCAGFARYMDADITLIRVLWLLITIFSGIVPGLVVYLVAWIAMPADYSAPVPAGRPAGA